MEGSPKDQPTFFFLIWHLQGRESFHSSWDKKCFCGVRFVNCEQFGFVYIRCKFVLSFFKINFYIFARIYIYIYSYIYRRQSITLG